MKRGLLVLLLAAPLHAATFLVPSDHDLVTGAKAVVVATAGPSRSAYSPSGWIETVTQMTVGEAIRGPFSSGDSFEVTELGGIVGDVGYAAAGAPRYAPGERVLLFLDRTDRGAWTAKNMAVGKFAFVTDGQGRTLLLRDAGELTGWDTNGAPHRESRRVAAPFLDYVRGVARGESPPADYLDAEPFRAANGAIAGSDAVPSANSYLLQGSGAAGTHGLRWNGFPAPVTFLSHGTQPGAVAGGLTSAQRGLAAWTNDLASNVVYLYGGTTSVSNGLSTPDSINTLQFNDPNGEIPGSFTGKNGDTLAIGGAWYGSATHTFNGETFYTIQSADLVVQDGISGAGLAGNGFDHVITHELGHTLGLRHSDEPPAGGTSSTTALMNSSVAFNSDPYGATLQAWDREALAAVYGDAAPACSQPQITAQPQSVTLGGADVVLSVTATGSAPLQYQWYVGQSGSTARAVDGGTTPQISVRPAVTTSYWVRVSNGCGPAADSATATVTVNGCPAVLLTSVSGNVAILQGKSTVLAITASGGNPLLAYQWFRGHSGDTSEPVAGATTASLTVSPQLTSTYWVMVTNGCGAFAASDDLVVTVAPCDAPQFAIPPAGGIFVAGDSLTLSATVLGTAPLLLQWLQNGVAIPNATAATFTTAGLSTATTFSLRATNDCGTATSDVASWALVSSCIAPSIGQQPSDRAVAPGTAAILEVSASGTALTYRWYEGARLDFTRPVGASAPRLYLASVTTQKRYWVRITNRCGTVDSLAATVTPGLSRRRSVGR